MLHNRLLRSLAANRPAERLECFLGGLTNSVVLIPQCTPQRGFHTYRVHSDIPQRLGCQSSNARTMIFQKLNERRDGPCCARPYPTNRDNRAPFSHPHRSGEFGHVGFAIRVDFLNCERSRQPHGEFLILQRFSECGQRRSGLRADFTQRIAGQTTDFAVIVS